MTYKGIVDQEQLNVLTLSYLNGYITNDEEYMEYVSKNIEFEEHSAIMSARDNCNLNIAKNRYRRGRR